MSAIEFIRPQWPAPSRVCAAFTLRTGGASRGPFDSLNLGAHVGDEPAAVAENRSRLRSELSLPAEPLWLEQVHGTRVMNLDQDTTRARADAAHTREPGKVCVIQVADCMPLLFAARDGSAVAAAHAGWRGLANGVIEETLSALSTDPRDLLVWLGPAIGPEHFEVGDEVRAVFVQRDPHADAAFTRNARGRWQCDLYMLARQRLAARGVQHCYGGEWCTYADPKRFFSYRRDGQCGRMAALIWLRDG